MADVTENSLRAVVKALTDVIAPAVDKADPLALEQLRLVVDYVEFVRGRLDFLYDRDRFELRHHLAMADKLKAMAAPCAAPTAEALAAAVKSGTEVYARAGASTPALKSATADVAAAIRVLVREAAGLDDAARSRIERCVIDASEERIDFERAWYVPLGFDPAPREVPPLPAVIDKLAGDAEATARAALR